jgi:photosystem II stability/assembly factor-like uncharacterized protein
MIRVCSTLIIYFILQELVPPIFPQTNPWKKLQSPVSSTLRSLSFVDSLTGWAAGEFGTIIHTTDGGENWEIQNSTIQTFITDIHFTDRQRGWAVTLKDVFPFNTVVLKTTNGGTSWSAENFQDNSAFMRTIFFMDSLTGFIGGTYIARTTNGGTTWERVEVDSNMVSGFPIYSFNFYNNQFGYACGGRIDIAGVVWRTTNSGLNWTAQGISPDEIFDIYIIDSLNAVTLSGDPEGFFGIAKLTTSDAGLTWGYEDLLFFGLSFTIDFRTYNEGWSASGNKLLYSSDTGESWIETETPENSAIYDLQFVDPRTGYAVGLEGVILKMEIDFSSVDVESGENKLFEFKLYQNYPNPFNPQTSIRYTTDRHQTVILKVYDALGVEIATLVNDEKEPGTYEIEFNINNHKNNSRNLTSGVYFYQLQIGSLVETKKMLYIK